MEYTVLGDTVNLSARLMANAPPLGILVCENTHHLAKDEIRFEALTPIKVKGKTALIPIFKPTGKEVADAIGCPDGLHTKFPWRPESSFLGGRSKLTDLRNWMELVFIRRLLGETNAALPATGQVQRLSIGGSQRNTLGGAQARKSTASMSADLSHDAQIDTSLFSTGGPIVLCGPLGLGRIELCEYLVTKSVERLSSVPIFGTLGPRPNTRMRSVRELLKSSLAGLRCVDVAGTMPADDLQALKHLVPKELASDVWRAGPILAGDVDVDHDDMLLKRA